MTTPLAVGVLGATGRMGRTLLTCVAERDDLKLAAAVCAPDDPRIGRDAGAALGLPGLGVELSSDPATLTAAAVILDFSTPAASLAALPHIAGAELPWVIGTTGFDDAGSAALRAAAERSAIVLAPNTSFGVALVQRLVAEAARALPEADIEIVEAHHRGKLDAPSGTALALASAAAQAGQRIVSGRSGQGRRTEGEIGIASLRGGQVVGEHRVTLYLQHEEIQIGHRALDRRCFADGALRAARLLQSAARPAGLYRMQDLVELAERG